MPNLPKTDAIIYKDEKFHCAECDDVTFDNWYEIYKEIGAVFCETCGIELTKDLNQKQNYNITRKQNQIYTKDQNQHLSQDHSKLQKKFRSSTPSGNEFKFKDLSDEMKELNNELKQELKKIRIRWNKFWEKIKIKFKEISEKLKKKFDELGEKNDEKFKEIDKRFKVKSEEMKQKMKERNEKFKVRSEEMKQKMKERNEMLKDKNSSIKIKNVTSKYNLETRPNPNYNNQNLSSIQSSKGKNHTPKRPNFDAITGERIIYNKIKTGIVKVIPRFDSQTGLPLDGNTQKSNIPVPKFDMKTGKSLNNLQPIYEKETSQKQTEKQNNGFIHLIKSKSLENALETPSKKLKPSKQEIKTQSEKVFTVLEPDIRERLLKIKISDDEKNSIAKSLIYLNPNVRAKYLEEFEHFTSQSNEKTINLIKKIRNLPIPEEQKNILIDQLDYLLDEKKTEFVDYLEQGIESDMKEIENDIVQFEKEIQNLKSNKKIVPKQKSEKKSKKQMIT